jgi:hypothetical protein
MPDKLALFTAQPKIVGRGRDGQWHQELSDGRFGTVATGCGLLVASAVAPGNVVGGTNRAVAAPIGFRGSGRPDRAPPERVVVGIYLAVERKVAENSARWTFITLPCSSSTVRSHSGVIVKGGPR